MRTCNETIFSCELQLLKKQEEKKPETNSGHCWYQMLPSKNLARHYNQLNDKVTSQKQGTFSVDCLFPVKESNHNEEI